MIHQGHFIAVVGAFLMGCSILLVVGCAGVRSEAPQEQQGHTEATKEQTHSGTATSEEARCEGTRTFKLPLHESAVEGWELRGTYTTNDVPACLKGGPLSGTDKGDHLAGEDGEDEVRSLGGRDKLLGGSGSDVLYGGADHDFLYGQQGDDVLYGGDGDDLIDALRDRELGDQQLDKLYCGEGWDQYYSDKLDHVSSSCEKKLREGVVA